MTTERWRTDGTATFGKPGWPMPAEARYDDQGRVIYARYDRPLTPAEHEAVTDRMLAGYEQGWAVVSFGGTVFQMTKGFRFE